MDSGALVVVLAVTSEVSRSSARASRAVENINNRVGAATSSRVTGATVVGVEAHVSTS
jgi:hypothetical protein